MAKRGIRAGGVGSNQYQSKGVSRPAPTPRSDHAAAVTALLDEYTDPDARRDNSDEKTCPIVDRNGRCYAWLSAGVCPEHGLVDRSRQLDDTAVVAAAFTEAGVDAVLGDYAELTDDSELNAAWRNTGIDSSIAEDLVENDFDPVTSAWWVNETGLPAEMLAEWDDQDSMVQWTEAGVPTKWEADRWEHAGATPSTVQAARERGWGATVIALQKEVGDLLITTPDYLQHRVCGQRTAWGGSCPLGVADGASDCGRNHSRAGSTQLDALDPDEFDDRFDSAHEFGGWDNVRWMVDRNDDGTWFGALRHGWDEDGTYSEAWQFPDEDTATMWSNAQREENEGFSYRPPPEGVFTVLTFPHSITDGDDWDLIKDGYRETLGGIEGSDGRWRVLRCEHLSGVDENDILDGDSIVDKLTERYCDGYGNGSSDLYVSFDGRIATTDGDFEAIVTVE